jgi:tetratricopeptide (TPR) repeat protein
MEINYSGKSVLIVDNKLEDLGALRQILGRLGFTRIQVASSVNMALSLMRIESYELCFVSYELGKNEKNGLQLLHEANAEAILSKRNLFVLVVDPERSHLLFGSLENSPDTYISKPYDLVTVRTRLEKVLRIKQVTEPVDRLLDEGELESALRRCDQLAELFPALNLYLFRLKGIILLQLHRAAEALSLFESLMEKRELPWAEVGAGAALFQLGQYDEALRTLNRVVDSEHICSEAFSWLGRAHWAKGALSQAINLMRKAVLLQPTVPQLQRELADLAAQGGDWKIAIDAYRSAIRYARYSVFQEPSAYFGIARAMAFLMKSNGRSAELELDVIRVLEDVVLDHQGHDDVGLRAKLCAGDVFRIARIEDLSQQRLRDAWAMYQQLETELQCLWLDALLDVVANTPLAEEVGAIKKKATTAMVSYDWGKANLRATMAYRKGEFGHAYLGFRDAYEQQPEHVGIALNLVQAGLELARRDKGNAEATLLRCDEVLLRLRFGELSERQQTRYRALAQQCVEAEKELAGGAEPAAAGD